MVEQQFQPILDSFGRGEMSVAGPFERSHAGAEVKDLYDATEWSTRWVWPFDLWPRPRHVWRRG